jgi:SAM-dependent methyltransferase
MAEDLGGVGRVLVIGGGEIGSGAQALYAGCDVFGTDIYPSPHTQVVADAHRLPFVDGAFDGVWIQAVLEHVLEPAGVVAEIHRVLKDGGVVYADTPFMQQVHEGAYDFTRFTLSGQRWLFRRFEVIEAGATSGAGSALVWSIRHFFRSVTGSRRLGQAASALFFWLSWFDGRSQRHEDAAGGTWLYARKSANAVAPREMVAFYESRGAR